MEKKPSLPFRYSCNCQVTMKLDLESMNMSAFPELDRSPGRETEKRVSATEPWAVRQLNGGKGQVRRGTEMLKGQDMAFSMFPHSAHFNRPITLAKRERRHCGLGLPPEA